MGIRSCALLALLICASCARTSPWGYQEMASCTPAYHSAQITFTPENIFNGVGIQLTQTSEGTRAFFNVYTRHIPTAEGIVWIDEKPIFFKGTLMEGGQRLLLPPAVTEAIIESLLEGKEIIASLQDHTSLLPSDNFASLYHKMQSIQ